MASAHFRNKMMGRQYSPEPMLMNDEDSLIQAVLDTPDDDAPRLNYADWLAERGDHRGEFIRLQCQLWKTAAEDPRRSALKAREKELLEANEDAWCTPLKDR